MLLKELHICTYNSATKGATLLKQSANSSACLHLLFYIEKSFCNAQLGSFSQSLSHIMLFIKLFPAYQFVTISDQGAYPGVINHRTFILNVSVLRCGLAF